MILGGIDFSLNSSGICLYDTVKQTYTYLNLYRNYSKKTITTLTSLNVKMILNTSVFDTKTEMNKIQDGLVTIEQIFQLIKHCDYIGIEGLSFGSKGHRLAEISGYQYLLRAKIFQNNIPFEVYPPKTIKKFAGNGNFKKEDLFNVFLNTNNSLAQNIKDNKINLIKPLDDLIDAYFIVEKLKTL